MSNAKYEALSQQVLEKIGGKDNIESFTHCITRMRFEVKDQSKVDYEAIKRVAGVVGVINAHGQVQIVIGQDVAKACEVFTQVTGVALDGVSDENLDKELTDGKGFTLKSLPNMLINTLQGCVFPIISVLSTGGFLMLIATLIGPSMLNLCAADSDIVTLFNFAGNAAFYFFPMFLAWSSAKYFKTSIPVALLLAGIMIHPTLLGIVETGEPFTVYGIPMTLVTYSSQFLPAIIVTWVMSYVYRFFKRHIPEFLSFTFVPLLTVLVMIPLMLCVLGPSVTWIANGIAAFITWLADVFGLFARSLLSGVYYFAVIFGVDKIFYSMTLQSLASQGFDALIYPCACVCIYALMGVGAGRIFVVDKDRRAASITNELTLVLGGISEPVLYMEFLPYKYSIVSMFCGGFVGGLIAAIFNCTAYNASAWNVLFAICFVGGDGSSFVPGIIACVVSFSIAFVLEIVLGRRSERRTQVTVPDAPSFEA